MGRAGSSLTRRQARDRSDSCIAGAVGSTITREPSLSPCSGARLILELPSFAPDPALLDILGTLVTGPVKEIAEIGKVLTPF